MTEHSSDIFSFREGWKSRGRELNDLYAALRLGVERPTDDPVEDLRALVMERDQLRISLADAINAVSGGRIGYAPFPCYPDAMPSVSRVNEWRKKLGWPEERRS